MLTVNEIITRVRATTHDEQETGYTDETLLGFINDGVHFLRRAFMDINPLLLADLTLVGTLAPGENEIIPTGTVENSGGTTTSVTYKLSNICDLRVAGKRLQQVKITEIGNLDKEGKPDSYYMIGHSLIKVWPIPNETYTYSLVAVKDMESLTDYTSTSPFPREVDDFLYEYVSVRASLTNEFDMSQENSIMASILQQVEQYAFNLSPIGVQTKGYWDAPIAGERAYTRRGRW